MSYAPRLQDDATLHHRTENIVLGGVQFIETNVRPLHKLKTLSALLYTFSTVEPYLTLGADKILALSAVNIIFSLNFIATHTVIFPKILFRTHYYRAIRSAQTKIAYTINLRRSSSLLPKFARSSRPRSSSFLRSASSQARSSGWRRTTIWTFASRGGTSVRLLVRRRLRRAILPQRHAQPVFILGDKPALGGFKRCADGVLKEARSARSSLEAFRRSPSRAPAGQSRDSRIRPSRPCSAGNARWR